MNKSISYIAIIVLVGFWACYPSQRTIESDYTYLYDKDQKLLKPSIKVFHESEDSSTIYFNLNSNDLLFGKFDNDTAATGIVGFKYKLWNQKQALIDSSTYTFFNYGKNNDSKLLQGEVRIKCPSGESYQLELRVRDEYKDFNVVHYIDVHKDQNVNLQYFLFKFNDRVLCQSFIPRGVSIEIQKSDLISDSLFVLESNSEARKKASPPFAMAKVNEKIFNVENQDTIQFENNQALILFEDEVNRFYPVDKFSEKNYVFCYSEHYPEIAKVHELIEPLRYISTTNEYNKLKEGINKRKEFEAFWMQFARDQNHAKRMIAEYYQRVETTNQFFTSHKEGWKTDRGIIYIVYGQPAQVQKNNAIETWLYGEEDNILSVRFNFQKLKTEWSENDYELIRDANYKNNWYRAVDAWRQGKVAK